MRCSAKVETQKYKYDHELKKPVPIPLENPERVYDEEEKSLGFHIADYYYWSKVHY